VRRICAECRVPAPLDSVLLERLGGAFLAESVHGCKGSGCERCHGSGYKGRLGLYEVLVPDAHLRHLIASQVAITEITEYARSRGFLTLREDGLNKVREGLTTLEEIFRVLGPE
jgi:type II secretory ATPase GspE/PulE/Tfp pilus assembly ATPase PilB-like protein